MSIASAIQTKQQQVANAYTAVSGKGGTLPSTQNLSNLPTAINSITELKGETKTVTPTTSQQTITPSSGKNGITQVTVNAVTSAIDSDITAGNIKKDVSILGVTGTYEGATPTLTTKTITQNGTYNASSDNADGYSQVTVNVSGGGGGGILETLMADIVAGNNPVDITALQTAETQINAFLSI